MTIVQVSIHPAGIDDDVLQGANSWRVTVNTILVLYVTFYILNFFYVYKNISKSSRS